MVRRVRDAIHHFVSIDPIEATILDSPEVQRLRHVHQLAMTSQLYPGATHRRFEHSIGVMHLARSIFQGLTDEQNLREHPEIFDVLRDLKNDPKGLNSDIAVVSAAALLHDVGHLPFSHAVEDMLADGKSHESISAEVILSDSMRMRLMNCRPSLDANRVARAAVKPKALPDELGQDFDGWDGILREIIQSNIIGADRMDYLLRDSHHLGVAYGSFDVHRLINGLRLVNFNGTGVEAKTEETGPQIGIAEGSLQVAEQLLVARYFMFQQVYFHDTRVSFDRILHEFLELFLEGGVYPSELSSFLSINDNNVSVWIADSARDTDHPAHKPAKRLVERDHYRLVANISEREDQAVAESFLEQGDPKFDLPVDSAFMGGKAIAEELSTRYGPDNVRHEHYGRPTRNSIPVLREDSSVVAADTVSDVFASTPNPRYDYVYVDKKYRDDARDWLKLNRARILGFGGL